MCRFVIFQRERLPLRAAVLYIGVATVRSNFDLAAQFLQRADQFFGIGSFAVSCSPFFQAVFDHFGCSNRWIGRVREEGVVQRMCKKCEKPIDK